MPTTPLDKNNTATLSSILSELATLGHTPTKGVTRSEAHALLQSARRGVPAPSASGHTPPATTIPAVSELQAIETELKKMSGNWTERLTLELQASRLSDFSSEADRLPIARTVLAAARTKQAADNQIWKDGLQKGAAAKLEKLGGALTAQPSNAKVETENDRLIAILEEKERTGTLPSVQRKTLHMAHAERDGKSYFGTRYSTPQSAAAPGSASPISPLPSGRARLAASIEAGLKRSTSMHTTQPPAQAATTEPGSSIAPGRPRLQASIEASLKRSRAFNP